MTAQLITRFKNVTPEGHVVEWVIWKLEQPVPPSSHLYKYRAVYVVDGVRVLGFDNERGKGDHCHLNGQEVPYVFRGVDQLVEDFIAAIERRRST
jgi:Family of unknown function (DUF6516)